jgi:hypothetical protein
MNKSLAIDQIKKGLSVMSRDLLKFYLIQIKIVIVRGRNRGQRNAGGKMKDSLAMLLKTNGEKMTENTSLAMLMKAHELKLLSGDVIENRSC